MFFLLFFARYQTPEKIARLIDERIAFYDSQQCELDEFGPNCAGEPGMNFVRGLGGTIYRAAADYMRANRETFLAELNDEARHAAE